MTPEMVERLALVFEGGGFANDYAKAHVVKRLVRALGALTAEDLRELARDASCVEANSIPTLCLTANLTLANRCRIHATKMDGEGWYVTANVLNAAADQIEKTETAELAAAER